MITKLKNIAATILANNITGYCIGKLKKQIVLSNGIKINTTSPRISNTIKAYLFWGMYESAESRCIQKHLPDNLPVVELGASLGAITCLISRKKPPMHIAVEANPHMIPLIRENLKANHLNEPVILNKAVSYSGAAKIQFRLSEDNTGSSISDEVREGHNDSIIEAETITLSRLLKDNNIDKYILVADIEGAECDIFRHDEEAIRNRCMAIIIELHAAFIDGKPNSVEDIRDFIMEKYKFNLIMQDGAVHVFVQ